MADTSIVWPEELRKRWASVFRIFYQMDPKLDNMGAASLTQEAEEIVQVAEDLRATPSAFQRIETELLNFNQMTFHSIVTNPVPWSNIGKRIRSSTIYQEAVIHLVGRWNSIMTEPGIETLAPATHQLCEKKHQELVLRKKIIELHMLSYYPESMHRGGSNSSPGSGSEDGDVSCASYANDIYTWMALAFFRQWFSHALLDCRNYVSADGGAFLYRVIGAGAADSDSYLDDRAQAYFNLAFPMSVKGRDVFGEKLRDVKVDMQGFVEELLVNRSRYCFAAVPYLTCCQVDREDLPWDDTAEAEADADAEDNHNGASWFLKPEQGETPDSEMQHLPRYDHGSNSGSNSGSSIHTSTSHIGTPDFNTGMGIYSTFSPMPPLTLQAPFTPCTGDNTEQQEEAEEEEKKKKGSGSSWNNGINMNVSDQMSPYDTRPFWMV